MNIYLSNESSFNNNGLGFLTDVIDAKVTDEINGTYQLELEYLINGHLSEYLEQDNIIKCRVSDGTYQLFRINYVNKTFDSIKITAYHIFYDLLNNFLDDVYPQNLNGYGFLSHILSHTNFDTNFTAYSDVGVTRSARYVRKNPVEAIIGNIDNSMINIFGAEIKRDNFKISLLNRLGENKGERLIIGKNITGIDIKIDIKDMATRVMPQGYNGLLLPELYVDSTLIDDYPTPKIKKLDFNDVKYDPDETVEDAYHNIEDAYDELRRLCHEAYSNGLDKPSINVKIDWIELSKTNEYKKYTNLEKINLGDTVTANILGLNYETRVFKTIYNPITDMVEKFEIGTISPTIVSTMNNLNNSIEDISPTSILEQARNNATQLINSAMGGYVYKTNNELFIMDTNDPETATRVWRWNINGLGYSSTGINGTYNVAMTMDGSIVADFITTGKLNTDVIEGYDSILEQVSKIYQLTNSVQNNGVIVLTNAMEDGLISLSIQGEVELIYPSPDLYPSSTLYPRDTHLIIQNSEGNQKIRLPINHLYVVDNVSDEFQIYSVYNNETEKFDYYARIIRRIEIDNQGNKSIAETETIEQRGKIELSLARGVNTLIFENFEDAFMNCEYFIINQFSNKYATKAELKSSIELTESTINAKVEQKVGTDEVIAQLNLAVENGQGVIDLKGNTVTIESDNFNLTEDGKIEATSGEIGGFNLTDTNFNKYIEGIYDYNLYDTNILKSYILKMITTTANALKIYDLNDDGKLSVADYAKMKAIIDGTIENTRVIKGMFKINSDNPKNCLQILDENGEPVVSLGIGGVNAANISAQSLSIADPDDYSSSGTINGVTADKSGKLYTTGNIVMKDRIPVVSGLDVDADHQSMNDYFIQRLGVTTGSGGSQYLEIVSFTGRAWGINIWASDKRLKDKINDTKELALNKILEIKHREFVYKDDEQKEIIKIGYIADELEKIDPQFIYEVGEDKIKNPNISYIIPMMSKAIQEQQEQICTMKNEIELLKEEIRLLKEVK